MMRWGSSTHNGGQLQERAYINNQTYLGSENDQKASETNYESSNSFDSQTALKIFFLIAWHMRSTWIIHLTSHKCWCLSLDDSSLGTQCHDSQTCNMPRLHAVQSQSYRLRLTRDCCFSRPYILPYVCFDGIVVGGLRIVTGTAGGWCHCAGMRSVTRTA